MYNDGYNERNIPYLVTPSPCYLNNNINFANEIDYMAKRREIRNSTAEFLIFQIEGKEQGVEVYYKDKTIMVYPEGDGYVIRLFL